MFNVRLINVGKKITNELKGSRIYLSLFYVCAFILFLFFMYLFLILTSHLHSTSQSDGDRPGGVDRLCMMSDLFEVLLGLR